MSDFSLQRSFAQERMFLDLVQRAGRFDTLRRALFLRFSGLSRPYDGLSYKRIAAETFLSGVGGMEGHFFKFASGDAVFVAANASRTMLEALAERVLAPFGGKNGKDGPLFVLYELATEHEALLKLAQTLAQQSENGTMGDLADKPLVPKTNPLSPDSLAALDRTLGNIDVTNVTRRQTVCTILDASRPQPLFEEVFVSISEMEKLLAPGLSLDADPWLFRYLTTALDQRVMRMLIRDGLTARRPFSLNLNVSTILTPIFARFENVIAPQVKGRLVIEMNKLDVFSDMNAFFFVRDYLHERGFRLCLDGVTHNSLPYCNRLKLGFDLIKLFWSPSALDVMPETQHADMRALVMDAGQAHTILCRCESEKALRVGQELGIVMFQGRYVDGLLTP